MSKRIARERRARRIRGIIRESGAKRMTVTRSSKHIYAQVIDPETGAVLAAASSVDKELRDGLADLTKSEAAQKVGELVAKRMQAAGLSRVAFDRSGFRYHGRVKALADSVREAGIEV